MRIIDLPALRRSLRYAEIIDSMRDALIANARGECDTPMPMHLAPNDGEVHIKSSCRRGGRYFAIKIASTFPGNLARGLPTGSGMMLLASAETGETVALLADEGHLTDVRTAAVAATVARECGRSDAAIGIAGSGIQARLQARMHAEVLPLRAVWIWGRTPERVAECRREIESCLPGVETLAAATPADLARHTRVIVTCTAARSPLLAEADIEPGTLITAVGSDSPGKQELDPAILRRASLVLADSRPQCEKLGELQHAPDVWGRAVEIGTFCESGARPEGTGITVCDLTGLGVEDLYIAEYCYRRSGI